MDRAAVGMYFKLHSHPIPTEKSAGIPIPQTPKYSISPYTLYPTPCVCGKYEHRRIVIVYLNKHIYIVHLIRCYCVFNNDNA